WPLVVLRGAVLVVSAHRVLRDDAANAYALENLEHERAIFDAATSVPLPVATALVRRAAGADAAALALPSRARLLADGIGVHELDLSATSPLLHEGRWLDGGAEATLAAEALEAGAGVVVTRFAEPRLTRSRPGPAEPANVVLGIDLTASEPVELRAPWTGELTATPGGLLLTTPGVRLTIAPREIGRASCRESA